MKIKQEHFIESIYSSLQYISYYHAPDFIKAMFLAYEKETNKSAKKCDCTNPNQLKNVRPREATNLSRHWNR